MGETIEVTVRVADYRGTPLGGANVAADVTRQPFNIQASTGFGLIDRMGEYDGVYDKTTEPGNYHFKFTVSDPTGQQFLPCYGEAEIEIRPNPTVEACQITLTSDKPEYQVGETIALTAQVTANGKYQCDAVVEGTGPDSHKLNFTGNCPYLAVYPHTDIAGSYTFHVSARDPQQKFRPCSTDLTVTVNQNGNEVKVRVVPETQESTLCRLQDTTAINVDDVTNLSKIELVTTYKPDVLQVIDADPGQRGVQVRAGNGWETAHIIENRVDTRQGRIYFVAELLDGYAINGTTGLMAFDWRSQNEGSSSIILEKVILTDHKGQVIKSMLQHGIAIVKHVQDCRGAGVARLQSRSDHSGIIVTNTTGEQAQTRVDGFFIITPDRILYFEFPGYLSAQVDLSQSEQNEGLDTITLLAGDVNGDNLIDVLDLAYVANTYSSTNSLTDFNADGQVNILDLSLIAGNYGRQTLTAR